MHRPFNPRVLQKWFSALRTDRRGITALEYGIIAGWLAFVIVVAFANLGTALTGIFGNVSSKL